MLAGVGASWSIYWWLMIRCIAGDATSAWGVRGLFGDMFGAFNALITAFGFAGLLYTLHLQRHDKQQQDAATRRREQMAALTAQLGTLIQIQGLPDDRRMATWEAICGAEGGPPVGSAIERAIAIQIQFIDRLAQGEDISIIPTYGRSNKDARIG